MLASYMYNNVLMLYVVISIECCVFYTIACMEEWLCQIPMLKQINQIKLNQTVAAKSCTQV